MPLPEIDVVTAYARHKGWEVQPRMVLVEGSSDASLYKFAADIAYAKTGVDLLSGGFSIIAAGEGDDGGTRGVVRELNALRCLGRACLSPKGKLKYRFIALLDNDHAGRLGINGARTVDMSIIEYKDVFRIRPVMPKSGNLDPKA